MSRIYFHFKEREDVEVHGSERAYMGCRINDLAWPFYGVSEYDQEIPLLRLLPANHYLQTLEQRPRDKVHSVKIAFDTGMADLALTLPDGTNVPVWRAALNTVYAIGGPQVRLMVRLHAQCEIHCWGTEADGCKIAKVVQSGLDLGIFRSKMGWEKLEKALGEGNGDWVCSYSVCEQFPNPGILDEEYDDGWYDQPDRWDRCIEVLKAEDREHIHSRRIHSLVTPYVFGEGHTIFDVTKALSETRTAAVP